MVIQSNLTKHQHLSAHFGLKYLSDDGINRDRLHCKNFPNIHTFRSSKKISDQFWVECPFNNTISEKLWVWLRCSTAGIATKSQHALQSPLHTQHQWLYSLSWQPVVLDIHDLTPNLFPLNRIANFFEWNQIANHTCSNQIFARSNQIPVAVILRFKSNRNLYLPITVIYTVSLMVQCVLRQQ